MKTTQDTNIKSIAYIIGAICTAVLIAFCLSSCGVTRATISRPAEGTVTTITITTNNPITTDVAPNVTDILKGK